MIHIATKTILTSVPQSINLEGSDIKFANTVRNLGVCLDDPTLSFQQQINLLCCVVQAYAAVWNFAGLVQLNEYDEASYDLVSAGLAQR